MKACSTRRGLLILDAYPKGEQHVSNGLDDPLLLRQLPRLQDHGQQGGPQDGHSQHRPQVSCQGFSVSLNRGTRNPVERCFYTETELLLGLFWFI